MITNIRGQLGGKHRIIDSHAPAKKECLSRLGARARRREKRVAGLHRGEESTNFLAGLVHTSYFDSMIGVPPPLEIGPEDLPRYSLLTAATSNAWSTVIWHEYVDINQ